ncbi:MAG TPA: hypothetical protein P5295_09865 [Spirochaetota bacterium]|nr:hypothetical protein [Spirochaetota bacterium]
MKIPADAIIPEEKFTRYLLVKRDFDDKSQYLKKAGYTIENYSILINDIKSMIIQNEAIEDKTDEYGTFYTVTGKLTGTSNQNLRVTTIWMKRKADGVFQFITLIPERRI